MAVRIYSLAKELKLDSKELVDICTKAGVPGKGSALASLSDEEVGKVKAFLSGPKAKPKSSKAKAPLAPEPPKKTAAPSKIRSLPTKRKAVPRPAPLAAAITKKDETEEEVEDTPIDADVVIPEVASETPDDIAVVEVPEETTIEAVETAPAAPEKPQQSGQSPIRRQQYTGTGLGGKMPVLGARSQRNPKAGGGDKKENGNEGRKPAIKLAPMPMVEPPKAKKKTKEPEAQKPDMKLPANIVRATASGQSRPLASHIRQAERVVDAKKRRGDLEPMSDNGEPGKAGDKKGRRGWKGGGEEESKKGNAPLSREQRQLRRNRGGNQRGGNRPMRRISRRQRRTGANTAAPRKDSVILELPCTIREFSEAAGVPASQIQRILMDEGVMTTINAEMDPELAQLIAVDLGTDIEFRHAQSLEEKVLAQFENEEEDPATLQTRPPVITFLGHVDHGKTSLLDKILELDVVSGESGGITQHIRAYSVKRGGQKIAFVDTPGHEAFTEMRARGANVTDIAVLVVAADDGIMPQTEEAISHARAAEVPIVVALNKIDVPGVNIDRVYQQLSANDLLPSEWGGDVEVVKTSAITGDGVDTLLETLLTVAELHEFKANPDRNAFGTCLEAQQEGGRGIVAKVLVQRGTLKVGDIAVCGQAFGRVKAIYDTLHPNKKLKKAGPSTPVNITGFDIAPGAGDHFYVLDDISTAREIAANRAVETRHQELSGMRQHVTLETLFDRLEGISEVQTLNVIIRADVRGSIEAIRKEFEKLDHPEVKIRILQATVGGITEADITLADASDAIVIGFNVVPEDGARILADKRGVQVRRYEIIYKITDDLKDALEGMLKPEEKEVILGRALVQRSYKISRVGTIAGCRVLTGIISRNGRARVIRDSTIIGDYPIDTLRREKDDAKEVREGLECGIKLVGFNDIKEADVLEIYTIEQIGRSFDG